MRRLTLLLALLSLAFAPVPGPKQRPRADLQLMQGTRVLPYARKDGVREGPSQEAVRVIDGDRLTTSLGGKVASRCFIRAGGGAGRAGSTC